MGITCHIIIQYDGIECKTEPDEELVAELVLWYNEYKNKRYEGCVFMPNGRKIYDIMYYLVKRKNTLNCTHCGKRLPAGAELYAKESKNGRLVVCRECVMRLSDQYQNETYGRIPFPKDEPLYVGLVGHFCVDREDKMVPQTAIFRKKTRTAIVPVFHCQGCGRYLIGTPEYQKHIMILSDYNLVHTLSNKPFPSRVSVSDTVQEPEKEPEYPESVVWSYKHPCQGGGCSGK